MAEFMKVDLELEEKEARANQERESRRRNFGKSSFYKLTEGSHTLRILPPGFGDKAYIRNRSFGMVVGDHWNAPGADYNERVRCVERTYPDSGAECPVCRSLSKLYDWFNENSTPDSERKAILGRHSLSQRAYVNAIVRESSETQTVTYEGEEYTIPMVHIVGLPVNMVFNHLREQMVRRHEDGRYRIGDFTDPLNGIDVCITRKGNGIDTRYDCLFNIDGRTPLHSDEKLIKPILASGNEIAEIFKYPKQEAVDRAKVIGDGIRRLVGAAPPPQQQAPTSETTTSFTTGRPDCFSNHVSGMRKCLICPVELDCSSDDATKAKSDEDRKNFHASNAA